MQNISEIEEERLNLMLSKINIEIDILKKKKKKNKLIKLNNKKLFIKKIYN